MPENELPIIPKGRPSPDGASAAVDILKVLLKMKSENFGVAPKVIAHCDDLDKIASEDEANVQALTGWRRELFGDDALRLKRGEIGIAFNGRQIVVVEQGEPVERVTENNRRKNSRNGRKKSKSE